MFYKPYLKYRFLLNFDIFIIPYLDIRHKIIFISINRYFKCMMFIYFKTHYLGILSYNITYINSKKIVCDKRLSIFKYNKYKYKSRLLNSLKNHITSDFFEIIINNPGKIFIYYSIHKLYMKPTIIRIGYKRIYYKNINTNLITLQI